MNCESKICVLENVQMVKCLSYQSVRKKQFWPFFFIIKCTVCIK